MLDQIKSQFSHAPSAVNPEFVVMTKGSEHATICYLADDCDAENPLDMDGEGEIHTTHRHDRKGQIQYQEALALDDDFNPDLELVLHHPNQFRKAWVQAAALNADFQEWADTTGRRLNPDSAYYMRRAKKFWQQRGMDNWGYGEKDIWDFDFTVNVQDQLWSDLRNAGVIGDQDAVLLDIYDHGGQVYSISGEGLQCRWDTSRGAAVWVPDDSARDEIERRMAVYAFGRITKERTSSGDARWLVLSHDKETLHETDAWYKAFEWLQSVTHNKVATADQLHVGRKLAAEELARGSLDLYNAWLRNDCYGVCTVELQRVYDGDSYSWKITNEDAVWSFIGSESAESELKGESIRLKSMGFNMQ